MLIKFFPNGKGTGAGPVGYLVAREVLAYDENRDLIRGDDGQPLTVIRTPLPEVLRGDPGRTEALIDACPHDWSYRAGVIAFTAEDAPSEADQQQVMDRFEELAFAGLDPDRYDMLWVRHSHEGRVELHFCTPRMELESGKSLNIAPPGYERAFDSLRDLMNETHGWTDPMDASHAQEVRRVQERPDRAEGREGLQRWILDQISVGLIEDRAQMAAALTEAGFELPRQGKDYITVKDPETGERWRLKGEIFHEDWQAGPDAPEREAERGAGHDPGGSRRLDAVSTDALQAGFAEHCDRRARYNRERYPELPSVERAGAEQSAPRDLARDAARALGDGGDLPPELGDLHRAELALEPGVDPGQIGLSGAVDADRGGELPVVAARDGGAASMHGDGAGDALLAGEETLNGGGDDRAGARIAGLRRTVGERLRDELLPIPWTVSGMI
ncbi:mobilization relaxase [Sinirhodobacter ferrireducens]|uniref:Mobilization relaxase n=1 Tax=Paenirhodobacter ferrireducens TaxID=1215032 RepID=A0A443LDI2_9RHOB|nr:relaxase/mobilization nuclease domain-containing protein [Sinirhodobacter ferrireducens]RWR47219.1 mobilization relaxase [Sinirhodobacter ferrireducens]